MNNRKDFLVKALQALVPKAEFISYDSNLELLDWKDERPKPSDDEINAKIIELQNAEPLILLREERDKKLAETDWWTLRASDGVAMTQEQKDYRQALRDLPSTESPQLDENGQLSNVTWPTKPE
tara:strand:- start:180 stop:551 length:372 start_codon:yes stop_codon:yes gene_type:complete